MVLADPGASSIAVTGKAYVKIYMILAVLIIDSPCSTFHNPRSSANVSVI